MRTLVKGMISLSTGFSASVPVHPSPYSILPELTAPPPPPSCGSPLPPQPSASHPGWALSTVRLA